MSWQSLQVSSAVVYLIMTLITASQSCPDHLKFVSLVELVRDVAAINSFKMIRIISPAHSSSFNAGYKSLHEMSRTVTLISNDGSSSSDVSASQRRFSHSTLNLVAMLTPWPMFKQNKYDYFIIWTRESPSLDTPSGVLKFRLKMLVKVTDDCKTRLFTVCFHCDSGQPSIVPTRQSNELTKIDFSLLDFNFNGTVLKVTATNGAARSGNFHENPDGSVEILNGYSRKIFECLRENYNFNYVFKLSRGFGIRLPNGSYTGLVGTLLAGYDFAFVIGWSLERYRALDFLPPCTYESLTFLTAVPQPQPHWDLVRKPLSGLTWFAVMVSALILCALFRCFGNFYRQLQHDSLRGNDIGIEIIVRSLLEQSSRRVHLKNLEALRLLAAAWLLTLIVLGTLYKGKLTTLMAYPTMEKTPSSFEELADSDYVVILHDLGGFLESLFSSSTNAKLMRLRGRFIKEKSLFKCIEATILTNNVACITLGTNGVFESIRNFSNTYGKVMAQKALTKRFLFLPGGAMLRKGQPFFYNFQKTISGLIDFGLVYKFQRDEDYEMKLRATKWAKNRAKEESWRRPGDGDGGPQGIELADVVGVLIVCGVLLCISVGVFLSELYRFRCSSCGVLQSKSYSNTLPSGSGQRSNFFTTALVAKFLHRSALLSAKSDY